MCCSTDAHHHHAAGPCDLSRDPSAPPDPIGRLEGTRGGESLANPIGGSTSRAVVRWTYNRNKGQITRWIWAVRYPLLGIILAHASHAEPRQPPGDRGVGR